MCGCTFYCADLGGVQNYAHPCGPQNAMRPTRDSQKEADKVLEPGSCFNCSAWGSSLRA